MYISCAKLAGAYANTPINNSDFDTTHFISQLPVQFICTLGGLGWRRGAKLMLVICLNCIRPER